MDNVIIRINDGRERFLAGETVSGAAEIILPAHIPITDAVTLSFTCIGEVKWSEYPSSPYYMDGYIYYEDVKYHEEILDLKQTEITELAHERIDEKRLTIPFNFIIPKDKNLPSTMVSAQGQIQYSIKVTLKEDDEVKTFTKDIIVQAPMEKLLMITVGGTVEKFVLLHGGKVSMHASISRKGFAPGEHITVHVQINNQSSAKVTPRASLHQLQIFMSGVRHKTIETLITDEPVYGAEVGPNHEAEVLLDVKLPSDESLSIKSSVITVKYFIHVTLDIPHSFDLHLNLPIVVTAKHTLDSIRDEADNRSEALQSAN